MEYMIDLETLGKRAGYKIISIGCAAFTQDHGIVGEFYQEIDPAQDSLLIDPGTVAWWMAQNDQARRALMSHGDKVSLVMALSRFTDFFESSMDAEPRIWAHGASFDVPILEAAYYHENRRPPWDFRGVRDTRTLFDLAAYRLSPMSEDSAHHAFYDARHQALGVIEARSKLYAQKTSSAAARSASGSSEEGVPGAGPTTARP